MNTAYRSRLSPYQLKPQHPIELMRQKAADTQDEEHPARKEIERVIGNYQLVATIEEDKQTLETLGHIPGLIAFICNVKRDGELIGTGRGSAVLNGMSKFIVRAVRFAANSSVLNAIAQSTKAIDSMVSPHTNELGIEEPGQDSVMAEGITDKQRSFLTTLVRKNVHDESTLTWWANQIETMDSKQASDAIKSFVK